MQYIQSSLEFLTEALAQIARAADSRAPGETLGGEASIAELLDEIPRALADAGDGVRRVRGIVRSVRDYAHPSKQREDIDVNRQIRAAVDLARNQYKHDAELVLDLGDLPPVPGNADELAGAILNLLINAAQAVHDARGGEGPRGQITITSHATAEFVSIDIADTGIGIAPADRERVFEPFFTTKPIGQGTGQGLAIARAAVVEGHRGTLTLDSELGCGTTFHLKLPIARTGVAA